MQALRIVMIGAGSRSFGPAMVRDVFLSPLLHAQDVELVLMDKAADRLPEIAGYAGKLNDTLHRRVRIVATTDVDEALRKAAFVITAIDRQRELYWSMDFHVPRNFGFRQVFGENGGPGGLFHALRNMPPMIAIARAMERLCPDAWLLNFSNPEHKLCEAVSRLTSIRNVGLCHGVFMGLGQMAHILGMKAEDLDAAACGMNHFTWFQSVRDRRTGEDLYPRLRQAEAEGDWLADWHEIGLGRILFRHFGLWPSCGANHYGEYIRWAEEFVASEMQYFYDPADGHPWETGVVPEFVYSLGGDKTTRPWRKPESKPQPFATTDLRPSGELAVPIIEALACGAARALAAVNVVNNGAIPNLPADMVVEVPAAADVGGIRSCRMEALPEGVAALLRVQASIQKLLVEAFAEESRGKLIQAMLLEPTVDSYRRAVACVDELIRLQAAVLPPLR